MAENKQSGPVLVLGATGAQGGAVASALLAVGVAVRALVRDPNAAGATRLAAQGAELATGSFLDRDALAVACIGIRALFTMQNAPFADPESERREGETIVSVARAAGVPQIVHTSVSGSGAFHRTMPGFAEGRWNTNYWESKAFVEDAVRNAGFPTATILKPAFMMENFTRPKADFMFPDLLDDRLVTAHLPDTGLVLVAAADVGKAAAAAILDPQRFRDAEVELAGDIQTFPNIANILSAATGRPIQSVSLSSLEILARGQFSGWVNAQEWNNEVGYPARPADARGFGLVPTDLPAWAKAHANDIARR